MSDTEIGLTEFKRCSKCGEWLPKGVEHDKAECQWLKKKKEGED